MGFKKNVLYKKGFSPVTPQPDGIYNSTRYLNGGPYFFLLDKIPFPSLSKSVSGIEFKYSTLVESGNILIKVITDTGEELVAEQSLPTNEFDQANVLRDRISKEVQAPLTSTFPMQKPTEVCNFLVLVKTDVLIHFSDTILLK